MAFEKKIIALYIRLSVDDEKTDSVSIPTQRSITQNMAMTLPEYSTSEIDEFIDDGYSGTSIERPEMQRLLDMVRKGKVSTIIVKDFSRFARTEIEAGYYIEKVFPLYHIRFISVCDEYDNAQFEGVTGGIDVAFKFLINDFYSRDLSTKMKTARQAKTKRGEYQSTVCPYGYQKGSNGVLVPDEDTANNVRMIFEMVAKGISTKDIIKKLYELHIPTPAEQRELKGKKIQDTSRTNGVWCGSTILRMIADERYTGTYVGGKQYSIDVGSHHIRTRDESEWIKIADHHEAIISKELFEQANSSVTRFSQPNKKNREYLLRSKVFCGCCDHAMNRVRDAYYHCIHSQNLPDFACHGSKIAIADLESVIFSTIRAQTECILGRRNTQDTVTFSSTQQEEHAQKLRALQDTKRKLYEQVALGEIDVETYKKRKSELDNQITVEKNVGAVIAEEARVARANYEESVRYKKIADELNNADTLTKTLVDLLIKRVYVFPDNRIEIEYLSSSPFEG